MLRVSHLTLVINEFRCYETKIEASEKAGSCRESNPGHLWRIVRGGGCPAVVAQWQSTGGSSQRYPGFDSRRLPAFSLLYFHLITSKFIYTSNVLHSSIL